MEFNVQPYYDDFESNAKENNYLRLLFKPGYAVQARELTQIQSLLQNQIKSFADHVFQDGSPVIGGNISFDNRITFLKLEETYNNEDIEIDTFVDKVILRTPDSLVQAKTIAAYFPSGGTPTLLVKYLTGNEFEDGDVFTIAGTNQQAKLISSNATGKGSAASINDGIFYVDGYFVQVQAQNVVIDAYSQNANVKVGLEISDDVVDYLIDTSLLDPAQDAFNYQAPGADRYQFNLNLSTRPLTTAVDESSFFELMRIENGIVTKQVKYPIYSELEKTLARRTYDESGDYTVTPFVVLAANSTTGDSSKYSLEIEPGKAYVKGYEFETLGKIRLEADKPRSIEDERTLFEVGIDTQYGNYLQVKRLFGNNSPSGLLDVNSLEAVDIHCVPSEKVSVGVRGGSSANFTEYNSTKIGTTRVRNIKRYQPQTVEFLDGANTSQLPSGDSNGIYNIYVTDIDIKPKIYKIRTGSNANTVVFPTIASSVDNAYTNMTITVMPFRLETVANANVNISFSRWVHRHGANTVDLRTKFTVGNTVRVGDELRTVVRVSPTSIIADRPWTRAFQSGGSYGDIYIEKQLPFSSNVTGQTKNIIRYDGATRTAFFDKPFDEDAVAAPNTIIQLNPKFKDVESLIKSDFSNLTTAAVGMSANVYAGSKNDIGDVWLQEDEYKSLIYRLPRQHVQRSYGGSTSLQNVDYYHNKYIPSVTVTSSQFTIEPGGYLSSGQERIDWLPTNSNIEDNLIVIVRNKGSATTVSNGEILRLTSSQVNLNGLGDGIAVNLSTNGLATGVSEVSVYVVVRLDNVENNVRRKTYVSNTTITSSPTFNYPTPASIPGLIDVQRVIGDVDPYSSTPQTIARIDANSGIIFCRELITDIGSGESINLYVPDVIRVREVLKGNSTNYPDQDNFKNITEHFIFEGGQKDELYDHAKLTLKQGYPSPNARMAVLVDYYRHSEDSSNTFFTVDSYSQEEYEQGRIPVHYSRKYGAYQLRDCIDFRPTRKLGDTTGAVVGGKLSDPDSTVITTFKYWLPRIDKLVLTKTKEFKIIKGVSQTSPVPPDDDSDSMTLYTIYLPPYVHNVSEIGLKYNESKRYTMKDIAAMDKRIQRIEYYTSLNNIENRTLADPAFYTDNTKKEKYGLVGESFENYDIADYKDADFRVTKTQRGITAKSVTRTLDLKPYAYTNTKKNKKTVSLDYTEVPAITQGLASNTAISVQPFLFASFIGSISLSPELDYWVSEELKPEVIRAPQEVIRERTTIHEVIREIIIERPSPDLPVDPNPPSGTNPDTSQGTDQPYVPPIIIDQPTIPNTSTDGDSDLNTNPSGPTTQPDPSGPTIDPVTNNDSIVDTDPVVPPPKPDPLFGIDDSIFTGIIWPTFDFGTGFLPWQPVGIDAVSSYLADTSWAAGTTSTPTYSAPTYAPPSTTSGGTTGGKTTGGTPNSLGGK